MMPVPYFGNENAPDVTQDDGTDETNIDFFDEIPEYGDDEDTGMGSPTGEDI
jgi:hypothetical protein